MLRDRKRAASAFVGTILFFAGAGGALAQSCQEDFQKLAEKRNAQIAVLNKIGKATGGKMDPVAACPAARHLVAIENEMFAYMEKNKDWCSIPENVVDGFKQARAKTQGFASQACAVAAKVKKMQEEQAAGGPQSQVQRLPAGPL